MQLASTLTAIGAKSNKHTLARSSALYRIAFASLALVAISAGDATALPTGASLASGSANVVNTTSKDMVVTQTTDRAIIQWQGFDIAKGETTTFKQPSINSVTLNRVVAGSNPSQILGTLSANGQLILVNPNGVFFGAGSKVDVAGLVATSADTSNSNFLAGNLIFDKPGKATASVINEGTITAKDPNLFRNHGLVALIAPGVRNDGVINAYLGSILLGSGSTATLTKTVDTYGDNLYSFAVLGTSTAAGINEKGQKMASGVENNGTLTANAGHVYLTANDAQNIVTNVVNNTGIIEGNTYDYGCGCVTAAIPHGGGIDINGGAHGNVRVSGSLKSSGSIVEKGHISVVGEDSVMVTNASITSNGGNLSIYSNNGDVSMDKSSNVSAITGMGPVGFSNTGSVDIYGKKSATVSGAIDVSYPGQVGSVKIWSDNITNFTGKVNASGYAGSVKIGSANQLNYNGFVDVGYVNPGFSSGTSGSGTLELDASNFTVTNVLAASIVATLNARGNVNLVAPVTGFQTGNITVTSPISWSGDGSLKFNAGNNIVLNSAITSATANGAGNLGSVTMIASNNVTLNNAPITTGRGGIRIVGKQVNLGSSKVSSKTGHITINNKVIQ